MPLNLAGRLPAQCLLTQVLAVAQPYDWKTLSHSTRSGTTADCHHLLGYHAVSLFCFSTQTSPSKTSSNVRIKSHDAASSMNYPTFMANRSVCQTNTLVQEQSYRGQMRSIHVIGGLFIVCTIYHVQLGSFDMILGQVMLILRLPAGFLHTCQASCVPPSTYPPSRDKMPCGMRLISSVAAFHRGAGTCICSVPCTSSTNSRLSQPYTKTHYYNRRSVA
jgi:hypothetical protein